MITTQKKTRIKNTERKSQCLDKRFRGTLWGGGPEVSSGKRLSVSWHKGNLKTFKKITLRTKKGVKKKLLENRKKKS